MRDAKHLSFVRKLPCCVCLRMDTVQAAHLRKGVPLEHKGGMGLKPSDCYTTPLCHECHSLQHNKGEDTFWKDVSLPASLAESLYKLSGDREKSIQTILRFNRVLRSQK